MQKILVYTDGEVIGDGVLRLPFAAALKAARPDAHLTWVSRSHSVYATTLQALAARFIDTHLLLTDTSMPLRDFLARPTLCRGLRFDLILDTQRNAKRSLWLKRIRHDRFVSAAANGLLSDRALPRPLSLHYLTRLLELGTVALGQPLNAMPLALPDGPWQEEAAALLPPGPRYIGFVVGAGHPDKCWPLAKFIHVAEQAAEGGDVPVFFLGPKEADLHAALRAALPAALFPLQSATSAAGSPYLTMALAAHLTAAVANDSGGAHLLAAGGAPLVVLFRSGTVRAKFMPATTRVIALAPKDFSVEMMQEIPGDSVLQALGRLTLNTTMSGA